MVKVGLFHYADHQAKSYAAGGLVGDLSQSVTTWLPDPTQNPRPRRGYPSVVLSPAGGYAWQPTLPAVSPPQKFDPSSFPYEWSCLEAGIAVHVTGTSGTFTGGAPTPSAVTQGRGVFHPYDQEAAPADAAWSTGWDAWNVELTPNHARDGMRCVQFLRSMALEWGLDPSRFMWGGESSGANAGLFMGMLPDLADPNATDHRRESTRLSGVLARNAQWDWLMFDDAIATIVGFNIFPDKDDDATTLCDKLGDAPENYRNRASFNYQVGADQARRNLNGSRCAYLIHNWLVNFTAVDSVAKMSYTGADTELGGRVPAFSGLLDPSDIADAAHDPGVAVLAFRRLLEIQKNSWHRTWSRLVLDSALYSQLAAIDSSFAEEHVTKVLDKGDPILSPSTWVARINHDLDFTLSVLFMGMPQQPVRRRLMQIREETQYATQSTMSSFTIPYRNWSARSSVRTSGMFRNDLGMKLRTSQLITPLTFEGRYGTIPSPLPSSLSGPPPVSPVVVDNHAARRALMRMLMQRKFDPSSIGNTSGLSLGDLRSWNVDVYGRNAGDSQRHLGAKVNQFSLKTPDGGGRKLKPIELQAQLMVHDLEKLEPIQEAPELVMFDRIPPSSYILEASRIRISPEGTPIGSDLGDEVIDGVLGLSLSCTRRPPSNKRRGAGVNASGEVIPDEPPIVDEDWKLDLLLETWSEENHQHALDLVARYRSSGVQRPRYNIRFDFGGIQRVLYVPLKDAVNVSVNPLPNWWNASFLPTLPGLASPAGARVFAVYGLEVGYGTGFQYVPKAGDTIRFQGIRGVMGGELNSADRGYVLRVGGAKLVADGYYSETDFPYWLTPSSPFHDAGINGIISILGGGDYSVAYDEAMPEPGALVTMWFQDYLHTPTPGAFEQMVPGGFAVQFDGVVLSGSEGPRNEESAQPFSFTTDASTKVSMTY